VPANPAAAAALEGKTRLAATGADKALLPTDTFEITPAGVIIRKPVEELIPGPWIITACNGHLGRIWHHYILYDVELNGYPFFTYSPIDEHESTGKLPMANKRVTVTKESSTGRNQQFHDNRTGANMSRPGFVKKIEQGAYSNYHVRTINGLKTPVSNPDGRPGNNLD